jgi:predicted O-methyltransferase YrrM
MPNIFEMRKNESSRTGLRDLINYTNLTDAIMIEIGCYMGDSTKIFADSGKFTKIYAVDPWARGYDNRDPASRSDFKYVESVFNQFASEYDIIEKMKMTSNDASTKFANQSVDLVYIDGDHRVDAVKNDIRNYRSMICPGGYLAGHDWVTVEVQEAILEVMGRLPDRTFSDRSWIYKL